MNIAIVDLDLCALSVQSKSPYLLSESLIRRLKNGGYTGFYICTHRCNSNDTTNIEININAMKDISDRQKKLHASKSKKYCDWVKAQPLEFLQGTNVYAGSILQLTNMADVDTKMVFTCVLAENITKLTKLKLLEVSTPDDSCGEANRKCGYGYRQFMYPMEQLALSSRKGQKFEDYTFHPCSSGVKSYDASTKNTQLLQIIHDVNKSIKDGDETNFDFFDDRADILESASKLDPSWLQKEVTLNMHLCVSHDVYGNVRNHKIDDTPRYVVRGTAVSSEECKADDTINLVIDPTGDPEVIRKQRPPSPLVTFSEIRSQPLESLSTQPKTELRTESEGKKFKLRHH